MQKFLRTLTLLAFMAMPWVANAQNTLTVADGTGTNTYVPIYGYWSDAYQHSEFVYPAAMIEEAADAFGMTGGSISSMTFYASQSSVTWGNANFKVYLAETTDATVSDFSAVSDMTLVYDGSLSISGNQMTVTFTSAFAYAGGNLRVVFLEDTKGSYSSSTWYGVTSTGSSVQGYNSSALASVTATQRNFLPKATFNFSGGTPITCRVVSNLTVSDITSNSAVLTWADANNTGATYTIYNGSEVVTTVAAGTYTYTLNNLEPNTPYTFSVAANCSATDASAAKPISFRTECAAIASLPFSDDFETLPEGTYQLPYCWSRINDATGTTNMYPYCNSSSTNAHSGTYYLYFYHTTNSSYADNEYAIFPELDVTAYPMNQNMVTFWARYSGSYAYNIEVGSMSDPTDPTTFVVDSVVTLTSTYAQYCVKLNKNSLATNPYVAFHVARGSSYGYVYVDDVLLEQMPSCWVANDLNVTPLTFTTATLTWADNVENTGNVTYNIYNGETLIASGVTSPYTLTGLEMDQSYVFSVVTDCGNGDLANASSINYTHGYCQPDPSSRDNSGLINVSFGTFMTVNNNEHPQTAPFYANNHSQIGAVVSGSESFNMDITWSTGYTYGTIVWVDWNNNVQFEDNEIVYTGTASNVRPTTLTATIAIPEGTPDGYYRVRVAGADSYFDNYIGGDETANHDACFTSTYAAAEDYTLYIGPSPVYTVNFNYLTLAEGVVAGTAEVTAGTLTWGSTATLTSTPATDMRTAAWYAGNISSIEGATPLAEDEDVFEPIITSDTTFTIAYGFGQFEIKALVANANQARMGSAAGNSPYGNDRYDYGTDATLTATANTGFQFIEWRDENGNTFSTENPLVLSATQAYTLYAHFGIASYTVDAETEHGTVDGIGTYTFGTSVTLTAIADDHYHFVEWADDHMTNAERSYRVVDNMTFHPVFEPDVYTVSVANDGIATYTVTNADEVVTDQYPYNTTATVEATDIDEHYTFVSWNVINFFTRTIYYYTNENNGIINTQGLPVYGYDDEGNTYVYDWNTYDMVPTTDVEESLYGVAGSGNWYFSENVVVSNANPYTFAVESNITLYPVYDAEEMTLTIATDDADMGSVNFVSDEYTGNSVTVEYNTPVQIAATPVGDYSHFDGWYNGTEFVSNANPYTYTVNQNVTLTAHFSFQQYGVTVSIEPAEAGTFTISDDSPAFSDIVTVTATANDHWVFDHWTYTGQTAWLGTNASYSEMVFEPLYFTAHFVRDNHTVEAVVADETHGTTAVTNDDDEVAEVFTHGTNATVSFTAGYGYSFAGWSDGNTIVSTDNPFTFEVEDNVTLTATVDPLPYEIMVDVFVEDNEGFPRGEAFVNDGASFVFNYLDEVETELTTEPFYGYVFDYWTNEDGDVITLPYQVTGDATLYAHFKKDIFTVTAAVAADYRMMGRTTGTGEYEYLDEVELNAIANTGYHFTQWVDAEGNVVDEIYNQFNELSGLAIDETILVDAEQDYTFYAQFDYNPYTVTATTNDPSMGNVVINNQTENPATLLYSQTVTLDAVAEDHYHFVQWQDGNTENPRTFILTEDVTFAATFAIDTHTVTLRYVDDQVESIELEPAAEMFEGNRFVYGTDVTASITPAYGYNFNGWSFDGVDLIDPANPFSFTLTQDTILIVNITPEQYTVAVESADLTKGAVEIVGDATVDYLSTVTIQATPEYGYDFVNWTNDVDDEVITTATAEVTVEEDITYTAHFTEHRYEVTALANTDEMGTVEFGVPMPVTEMTVADGTSGSGYLPVYGFYADSYLRGQMVYPAADLAAMNGKTITSLTYYLSSSAAEAWTGNFKVRLTEVADATINAYQSTDAATLVYDGTLDGTGSTMAITLAAPYTYHGGNLLIEFVDDQPGNYKSATFYGISATGSSVQGYSYSSLGAVSTNQRNFLPKVTFGWELEELGDDPVTIDPATGKAYVKYNNGVEIIATPNEHYDFENWTNVAGDVLTGVDNGDGTNTLTLTVTKDSTITANFVKEQYTIAVLSNDDLQGSVAITGNSDNDTIVDYNETVELVATPVDVNHRFLKWVNNAGDEFTTNPLTVTADKNDTYTATFGYQVFTLTANTEDINKGGVYVNDPNNVPAPITVADGSNTNSMVPVHGNWADAYLRSQVVYPAADLANMAGATITSLTYYLSSPAAAAWTGNFKVRLTEVADATISAYADMSAATVAYDGTLDATASTMTITLDNPYTYNGGNLLIEVVQDEKGNYKSAYFRGLTTTGASVQGYNSSSVDAITATQRNFIPKTTFTYAFAGTTPSLATSSAAVEYGTDVEIVATPAEHYHFNAWKNEADETVSTNANETITVAGDSILTATFTGDDMPVVVTPNYAIRGTVAGSGTYEYNTEVVISATAAHGYVFTAWNDGNEDNPRTITVGVAADNNYTAIFDYQTYNVDVTVENGFVSVTNNMADANGEMYENVAHINAPYYYGQNIELTFTANEHYHFAENDQDTYVMTISTLNAPEPVSITAVIDEQLVSVATADATMGSVSVDDVEGDYSESLAYGTELTIEATPAQHYHFLKWSDDETANPRDITVDVEDINLTAIFEINRYEVVADADAEMGEATWSTADGNTTTLTIYAYDQYGDGWDGNALNVIQNGETLATLTIASGSSNSTSVVVDKFQSVMFTWTLGGISYPAENGYLSECSFEVLDENNDELYAQAFATNDDAEDGELLYTIPAMTTVLPNTDVVFTATPNPGYEFVNWTNGNAVVTTDNPYTMTIVENTTLVANFNFVGFGIQVATNNEVMGNAYINDDETQVVYVAEYDEEVTLNAVAEYGYDFINWTNNKNDEVSTENPLVINADQAITYTANFNFHDFELVAVSDDEARGTVTGAGIYPYGTQVEISAVAADGFVFRAWNDGVTNATRTVTVDGITEYTASFRTDATYTVTVNAEHGTVSGTGSNFIENDLVTLNAVPATGYRFVSYTDAAGTVLSTEAAYSFNVVSDTTLTANFAAMPYTVTLIADATMGTVSGAGDYNFGTEATIAATPNAHYGFVKWSDDVTTNPRTIVVTGDVELTAIFSADIVNVAVAAVNGTVTGAGTFSYGDAVSLTATANTCYQFIGWQNGNAIVSTANPYNFTATENVTLIAAFEEVVTTVADAPVAACSSYTWNGQTYTTSGNLTAELTDVNGCDSIATLALTINTPIVPAAETVTECASYTWHGTVYETSGVYTYPTTDVNGCAVNETLNLTINTPIVPAPETVTMCGSYSWNGTVYETSGVYTHATTDVNGCPVNETLNLTINQHAVAVDTTATNCDFFEWNGTNYTVGGDYQYNYFAANGCDSIVTLHLTLNYAAATSLNVETCDSYTWEANNVTYTEGGIYIYETTAANGCDSTVTLNLTINYSTSYAVETSAMGSYEWNGQTYTESGVYEWHGTNAANCDSTVILTLTITPAEYTVTVGVNDAQMGNVNPAGAITVAAGETFTVSATANTGYHFVNWSNGLTDASISIEVVSDTTLIANFAIDTYIIEALSNDETMGTVTGSGEYTYGAIVPLTATAKEGYRFVRWSNGETTAHIEFPAVENVTITAYFESIEGIDDVEGNDVEIFSTDSKIVVKGAENMDVYVYDVNGRCVRNQAKATETVVFTMPNTGVYLVKVGNAPAKRVVVVR